MARAQVIVGVTPDMAFIKTVSDELVELMGSKGAKDLEQGFPQIILMAGLQVGGWYPPRHRRRLCPNTARLSANTACAPTARAAGGAASVDRCTATQPPWL